MNFASFSLRDVVQRIGERLRGEEPCSCSACRAPVAVNVEVYIWCRRCGCPVESPDGQHCGSCGLEAADKAPAQFYHQGS